MKKNKEFPSWLKIETFIILFFLLALTLNYFRISGGKDFESNHMLAEYLVLSGILALVWIVSWVVYYRRGF
jgi:hypothetical protein